MAQMNKVHGEYLEDFGLYMTLIRFRDVDADREICNAFLSRAGYMFKTENMVNKSFVAVGCNYSSVMILYVHDHSYILTAMPYDTYQKKLKARHPKWDVETILEELPPF
jgi:hypothetical protein